MEGPTKYARSGDVHIAYRVFGDGPRDIVLIPGTISHVELLWEVPSNEHLLKRLIAFARVIVFDKRGQGLQTGSPNRLLKRGSATYARLWMRLGPSARRSMAGRKAARCA